MPANANAPAVTYTIGYDRDADGNVTRLTLPAAGSNTYEATYVHDALGRVTAIHEGNGTAGLRLGGYGYDTASRRLALDRGNGTRTNWGWRPDGLVETLTHGFARGASVGFTYLYNREGGLSARTGIRNARAPHPSSSFPSSARKSFASRKFW